MKRKKKKDISLFVLPTYMVDRGHGQILLNMAGLGILDSCYAMRCNVSVPYRTVPHGTGGGGGDGGGSF